MVDRAFALLAAFDAGHRSLSLGELSRRSGIPTSSTLRLAGRLMAWGALERGTDGRFTVGLRLWEVASLAPRGQGLKQVALPFMGDLEEVTRQHVLLAVREGNEALLVERLSAHQAMNVLYRVGGRLPLHSTGRGPGAARLRRAGVPGVECWPSRSCTCRRTSPVSPAALRRTLAEIRREGLATIRRRAPQPLVSVAAPIFGADDKVAAALSVVVPQENAEPRLLGPAVRTAARSISRGLGARRSIGHTGAPTRVLTRRAAQWQMRDLGTVGESRGAPVAGAETPPRVARRHEEPGADPPRQSRRSSTCWRASSPSRRAWPTRRPAPGWTSSCRSPTRPRRRRSTCATTRRPARTARMPGPGLHAGRRRHRPALPGLAARRRVPDGRPGHARGRLDRAADLRRGPARSSSASTTGSCVGGVTYPVPHDDVVAAVRWVRDNAGRLGVDPDRISLGGASAGGNLATGAALRLRDEDGWVPAALLLAYTTFHAVVPPPSAVAGAAAATRSRGCCASSPRTAAASPRTTSAGRRAAPTGTRCRRNAVLEGLCPVLLLNSEYDDLRASAEVFAGQLAAAGVDVRQVRRPRHAARLPQPARRRRAGRPRRSA